MGTNTSHKIEARMKRDIDSTIDALEASIRSSGSPTPPRKAARGDGSRTNTPTMPAYNDRGYQFRQRLVLGTVGIIGIFIFALWGWQMKTLFYDAGQGTIGSATPFDTAGEHFAEAMNIADAHTGSLPISPPAVSSATTSSNGETIPTTTTTSSTLDSLIASLNQHTTTTDSSSTP